MLCVYFVMLTHSKLAAFSPGNFHRILGVDTRNFRGARFAGGYGMTMHNDIVRMLLEGCKLSGTAVNTEIHDGSLGEKEAQRQRAGNLLTFDPDGKGSARRDSAGWHSDCESRFSHPLTPNISFEESYQILRCAQHCYFTWM